MNNKENSKLKLFFINKKLEYVLIPRVTENSVSTI